MTADKQVRIYTGVDLIRAAILVEKFTGMENAQETGYQSAVVFGFDNDDSVLVYATRTAIIVRMAHRRASGVQCG